MTDTRPAAPPDPDHLATLRAEALAAMPHRLVSNPAIWRDIVDGLLAGPLAPVVQAARERDEAIRALHLANRQVLALGQQRDETLAALDRVRALADQWDDMARDHDEQNATVTAMVYRAHAKLIRRALGDQS